MDDFGIKPKKKKTGRRHKKRRALNIVLISIGALMLTCIITIVVIFNVYMNKLEIVPYVPTTPGIDIIKEPENVVIIDPEKLPQAEVLPEYKDTLPPDILSAESVGDSDVTITPDDATGFRIDVNDIENEKIKIRNWYNSGTPIYSANVTNILLMGIDNRSAAEIGRSDAMILVSINKSKKEITLVSFMRDNFSYMTDGTFELFHKLNHTYYRGGPELTVSTIENLFKIRIDNYVVASMLEFPGIIDTLGGIYLDVDSVVADRYGWDNGVQLLNGEKSLLYSRFRKVGSDLERTSRQQMVIFGVMDRFRSSSLSDINSALDLLLPSIRTGVTKTGVLGYASTAFFDGWGSYGNSNLSVPNSDYRYGAMLRESVYWFVDYPAQSQALQMTLYGATNIGL